MEIYKVDFSGEAYVKAETAEEAQEKFNKGLFEGQKLFSEVVSKVHDVEKSDYIEIEPLNIFGKIRNMSVEELAKFLCDVIDVRWTDEFLCKGVCEHQTGKGCTLPECVYDDFDAIKAILLLELKAFEKERERVNAYMEEVR